MTLDYEYITDPPILADVGTFELDIQNADLKSEVYFLFEDGILNADITFFDVFLDPIFVDFDGMSDISEFLSHNLNFALNVARDRYISLSKYFGRSHYQRINKMINYLLDMIPDEIVIEGKVIQGGISDKPVIINSNRYMVVPLDLSFHD